MLFLHLGHLIKISGNYYVSQVSLAQEAKHMNVSDHPVKNRPIDLNCKMSSLFSNRSDIGQDTPLKINMLHIIPWRFGSDHVPFQMGDGCRWTSRSSSRGFWVQESWSSLCHQMTPKNVPWLKKIWAWDKKQHTTIGSMGLVYLPTFTIKNQPNVGTYTIKINH